MPHSQGTRFTADPLTFIVRHQLWDGNVEDHSDQGVSIDVTADVGGEGFNGPSHFSFLTDGDHVSRMTIRA